ncbi:MAG: DUF4340 domain-containing protein [Spirochaetales bacterium]|nr:DUF4340 domain-containing protein [Spirochaetales bacterium]MCF7938211.1 DUF4340 domain-containing protein [Spirochaetales bacterium]
MQTKKRLYISSGILAVLVLLYFLGVLFSPEAIRKRRNTPVMKDVNVSAAMKIEIGKPNDAIEIIRSSSSADWQVLLSGTPFPAEEDRIDRLLDSLVSLRPARQVTEKAEDLADFGLAEGGMRHIALFDQEGNTVSRIRFGNPDPTGAGKYATVEGKNEVFVTDSDLTSQVERPSSYWSDLDLFPEELNRDDVISYRLNADVSYSNEPGDDLFASFTLSKEETENGAAWKAQGQPDRKLNNDRINTMVGSLTAMKGTRYVTDPAKYEESFQEPDLELTFDTADNRTFKLSVVEGDEPTILIARVGNRESTFVVNSYAVKRACQPLSELTIKENADDDIPQNGN